MTPEVLLSLLLLLLCIGALELAHLIATARVQDHLREQSKSEHSVSSRFL